MTQEPPLKIDDTPQWAVISTYVQCKPWSPMLCTKVQGYQPSGSQKISLYIGVALIFVNPVIQILQT